VFVKSSPRRQEKHGEARLDLRSTRPGLRPLSSTRTGFQKDKIQGLKPLTNLAQNRRLESISLQRGVHCEPHFLSPAHSPRGAGLPKDWLSNSAAPRLRRDRLLADEGKVQKIDSRNALVEAALVLPELHLFLDIGDV
jgi:hypothetical protein